MSDTPFVVRAARPTDLDDVLRLARAGGLPETGIGEGFRGFLIAEQDGTVIGACGLEEHSEHGLLRTVIVAAEQRRHGVGRALVEAALSQARTRHLRDIYLLTETARDFFAQLGFAESARSDAPPAIRDTWEFRTGCPTSATLMVRRV